MSEPTDTQQPIAIATAFWLIVLALCWALNSVAIKIVIKDIPSAWAAFLRFAGAFPFIALFIISKGVPLRVSSRQFMLCAITALISFVQIMLFNTGSQYTTGGRVTLLISTYPLLVPFVAHFMLKNERLDKRTVTGALIAFIGLILPLHQALAGRSQNFKGDVIEFTSSIMLALLVVTSKYAFSKMNRWTLFFWQSLLSVTLFALAAPLFANFTLSAVSPRAWFALLFQIFIGSVFAFLSFQQILAKHNSAQVSVFFFATPLFGVVISKMVLQESFDIFLIFGCLAVALGIFISNIPPSVACLSRKMLINARIR